MTDIEITTFSRIFVQLNDENRFKRKQALEKIANEIIEVCSNPENDLFICSKIITCIFDNGERNREITCDILNKILNRQQNVTDFLPIIIPEFVKKLADKDAIETSEEIRHSLMKICLFIIEKSGKYLSVYIPDIVKLCCNTLPDNYSEIKRVTCQIISTVSKLNDHNFYANSESLIKPIIGNLCHQHSKVRMDMVNCMGYVMLHNAAKSFDLVCSNLAQRLFDDNPNVRKSVIDVFGKWLLDLPDRYSFHSKLIPVFLSGYIDDLDDIRAITSDYWHDIGMKYQHENENDLKDQIDFTEIELSHYPKEYERPNLGCRILLFRTMSRILPALTRDLSDWSENTRIKAAKLLPYLILNAEGACTQHCQLLIGSTLIRGLVDEEAHVRRACRESARLLGYFVEPKVWWHILQAVVNRSEADDTFLAGELILLSCIIESSQCSNLIDGEIIDKISQYLKTDDICGSFSTKIKVAGLRCILSILTRFDVQFDQICDTIGYNLFYSAISFVSYETNDTNNELSSNLNEQLQSICKKFVECLSLDNEDDLYRRFLGATLTELIPKSRYWLAYSSERIMCSKLLVLAGPVVGEFVDQVIELLYITLDKNHELELRLKFFLTLVKLTSNINITLNSNGLFKTSHLESLLELTILPNLVWQSGRTAEALRRIAITCLWSTLVGCCKSSTDTGSDNLFALLSASVWHELLVRQTSALEEDLKDTRMISCKAMVISLDIIKEYKLVSKNIINVDYLHNIYPSFLKRMDDSLDEIRIISTRIFISWLQVLADQFDVNLYRSHIEELNSGLLIHLDDTNREVQLAVYEVLVALAQLCPSVSAAEISKVRHKHRSPKYCDDLLAQIQLPN